LLPDRGLIAELLRCLGGKQDVDIDACPLGDMARVPLFPDARAACPRDASLAFLG